MKNSVKILVGILVVAVIAVGVYFANGQFAQGRLYRDSEDTRTGSLTLPITTPIYKTIAKGISLKTSNPVGVRLIKSTISNASNSHTSLQMFENTGLEAAIHVLSGYDADDSPYIELETDALVSEDSSETEGVDNAMIEISDKNYEDLQIKIKKGDRIRLQGQYSPIDYYLKVKDLYVLTNTSGYKTIKVDFEVVEKNR